MRLLALPEMRGYFMELREASVRLSSKRVKGNHNVVCNYELL
jgi:hypothetical protein